jgi:hypothetical protein
VAPKPGFAAVYVGRPLTWNTSLVPLSIEMNGQPLVSLAPNSYTRIELRPGRYTIAAPDTYMTKVTYGTPRPLEMNVQVGKVYYVLPIQWAENLRPGVMLAMGKYPVATTEADKYGSFAVQEKAPSGPPPTPFVQLSQVSPAAAFGGSQ